MTTIVNYRLIYKPRAMLFFRGTMLPVDVFHFKSKHKVSDEFCQKHCNPSQWTELVGEDGEWVFNSSAAEQVNVWIGGYQAIVRDMLHHNYNFFLDKMVKRRNEVVLTKLRRMSKAPYHIPPYPPTVHLIHSTFFLRINK